MEEKKDTMIFRTEKKKSNSFAKYTLLLIALLSIASLLIMGCSSKNQSVATDNQSKNTLATGQNNQGGNVIAADNKSELIKTQNQMAQLIADGTYDNQVSYTTHSGIQTVEIKVTTQNDVVTDASVTSVHADSTSQKYIGAFNSALPKLVIGKKISDIKIPHTVSGSSLTSAAFKKNLADLVASNPA